MALAVPSGVQGVVPAAGRLAWPRPATWPEVPRRSSPAGEHDAPGAKIGAARLHAGLAAAGLVAGAHLGRRQRRTQRGQKGIARAEEAGVGPVGPDPNRLARLKKKMASMNVVFLGDDCHEDVDTISTGVLGLDMVMGGGWPRGRIAELYGPEASGKTTLMLHAIAEVQREGGIAAYVDVEHALDPEYCKACGVDIKHLIFDQPSSAEDALEKVQAFAQEGLDLVVLDSVAALAPQEEIEKGVGEHTMGLVARLMSKALRKITPIAHKRNSTVLFINQLRANIGGYGSPEVTTGGRALRYASSMRAEVRAPVSGYLKRVGGEPYGMRCKVKVIKNKIAPPLKTVEFDLIWGKGVVRESCVLEAALMYGVVQKKGAWFVYKDIKKQGRETFASVMKATPGLTDELEELAKAHASGDLPEEKPAEKPAEGEEEEVAPASPAVSAEGLFEVHDADAKAEA